MDKTEVNPEATLKVYAPAFEQATDYKVVTLEDYNHGGTLLKMFKTVEREFKARKDTALIPARAAVDAIRDLFKPGEEKIADCVAHIKSEMDTWIRLQNEERSKQVSKILSDSRTKAETKRDKLQAVVAPPATNTRTVRVLKVIDEKKIPREFFELNESKLKKFLMEGGTCPGAELVNEKIITA